MIALKPRKLNTCTAASIAINPCSQWFSYIGSGRACGSVWNELKGRD